MGVAPPAAAAPAVVAVDAMVEVMVDGVVGVDAAGAADVVVLVLLIALVSVTLSSASAKRRVRARLAEGPRPPGTPPDTALTVSTPVVVVAVVGLVTAWAALGTLAAVGLGLAAAAVPVRARHRARAERLRRRGDQLPVALDRLAAALRSGSSLSLAFDEVGTDLDPPLGPEVRALGREAARGRPVVEVLDDWSSAHDDPGTRLAASALVLAALVGSAPARAIDGVAATLRERLDLAAERHALAAQARTSALVLSVAPVGFAGLLVVGDTAAADFLLGTPAGWVCLALGLGLDACGAWWMTRLSRSEGS